HNKERWFKARFSSLAKNKILVWIQDVTEQRERDIQFERQKKWLAALQAIDLTIASSMDMALTLSMLLSHVTAQLDVDAADIYILRKNETSLEFATGFGFREATPSHSRVRLGVGYPGKAALERRIVHVTNIDGRQAGFLSSAGLSREEFVDYYAIPLVAKGNVKGVLEVFHRSPIRSDAEWVNFLKVLGKQAAIAIDNATLFDDLQQSHSELIQAYNATIEGWSHALDLRDKETEGHTRRVTDMTLKLAQLMQIPDEKLLHIQRGAILHDIGKMGIPDSILLKPGKLTDGEWRKMRQHPQYALDMLTSISYLRPALDIPHYHHERWNGSGYPHGLCGTQIPLAARIFAIADVYDALILNRPYRTAWHPNKAEAYIRMNAGSHFDPEIVSFFTRLMRETKQFYETSSAVTVLV
ncbi:MAG: HD domain-containing protein, partial [Anaerolineales bacterium]|nr:HD domain-containing protein [Anaerolineales bacterium]